MKWFKHDSYATRNADVERLIMEFGMDGYGLYFACLELIAGEISIKNLTFELEHDAALIADKFKMDTLKVENIMHRCIELGLFDLADSGKLRCLNLAKMLDESISKNKHIREIIAKIKDSGLIKGKIEFIYLFKHKDKNMYKIGKSTNPERRFKDNKRFNPQLELYYYFQVPDGTYFETSLHRHYNKKRIDLEWFELTNNDILDIKKIETVDDIKKLISGTVRSGSEQIEIVPPRLDKIRLDKNRIDKIKQNKTIVKGKAPSVSPESNQLAQLLYDEIMRNSKPTKYANNPPKLESWSKDIYNLLTIDKVNRHLINKVIIFATCDKFWKQNILSGKKLREKFTQLELKMNSSGFAPNPVDDIDDIVESLRGSKKIY